MKYGTIILLTLIFCSCAKNESFKKESWYKITNAPIVDTVLLKDIYFDKDDNLLMQIRWRPSKKIHTMYMFDENEKVKEWIAYYDTTMQNGQKCVSKYKNGEVVGQTNTIFQNDSESETVAAKFRNTFDDNYNLINTEIVSDNDTSQMNYRYNKEGLIEAQSMILASGEGHYSRSKYDTNNNLIWRENEYPEKQEIVSEIYNYNDTILISKIVVNNGDTIRQENYIYNSGEKSAITIIDKQETYKIIIKTQIADKLPATNSL